jgi:hypothetical protein
MSRFDYVKYDEEAMDDQSFFKTEFTQLEECVEDLIVCPRSKALILTKLEEAYMWIDKGIRNDQISRNGKSELLEERSNS